MATDDALRECLDQWRQGQPMTAHDDRLLTAALDELAYRREERDAPGEAGAVVGGHAFGDDGPAPPAWLVAHTEVVGLRADNAALVAALRRAVDELLDLGVTFPIYSGTAIVGYGCTLCAGTGEAEAAVEHAADCPVVVLARHDAARGEG